MGIEPVIARCADTGAPTGRRRNLYMRRLPDRLSRIRESRTRLIPNRLRRRPLGDEARSGHDAVPGASKSLRVSSALLLPFHDAGNDQPAQSRSHDFDGETERVGQAAEADINSAAGGIDLQSGGKLLQHRPGCRPNLPPDLPAKFGHDDIGQGGASQRKVLAAVHGVSGERRRRRDLLSYFSLK